MFLSNHYYSVIIPFDSPFPTATFYLQYLHMLAPTVLNLNLYLRPLFHFANSRFVDYQRIISLQIKLFILRDTFICLPYTLLSCMRKICIPFILSLSSGNISLFILFINKTGATIHCIREPMRFNAILNKPFTTIPISSASLVDAKNLPNLPRPASWHSSITQLSTQSTNSAKPCILSFP